MRQLRHGQLTIPKAFRDALQIEPDDLFRVTLADGRLEIVPVRAAARQTAWARDLHDLFEPVRKSLKAYPSEEIDTAIRQAVAESRSRKAARG